ncbi:MAG: DUF488 domain-containing protein [Nitrospinae bacterium]|nr:DUF488 domain-containing protein [Nitrospinota bacterium]
MKHPLWTIGHSNHSAEKFLDLLSSHGIACVVDVRSIPYSRRNPQFNRERMSRSLSSRDIGYVWEGEALGGKRDIKKNPELFDSNGRIDWMKVKRREDFPRAMKRLRVQVEKESTTVLCAEENPRNCHRLHLISAAWAESCGENISHIRGDGRVETHAQISPQPELFC